MLQCQTGATLVGSQRLVTQYSYSTVGYLRLLAPVDIAEQQHITLNQGSQLARLTTYTKIKF